VKGFATVYRLVLEQVGMGGRGMVMNRPEGAARVCSVEGCPRRYYCKGLCRLHWERQWRTGSTADPAPRSGEQCPAWKGDGAGYKAIHLRLSKAPRPGHCAKCGTTDGHFEWALRQAVPRDLLPRSPEGLAYSPDPTHYENLCKRCHNRADLSRTHCRRGHPLSGDNLYVERANAKRHCRACWALRRRGGRCRASSSTIG
jgi:hypothetical protein